MKNIVSKIKKNIKINKVLEEKIEKNSFSLKFEVDRHYKLKEILVEKIEVSSYEQESKIILVVKSKAKREFLSHQELGRRLDLFWFSDCSQGIPFFMKKGLYAYEQLQSISKKFYRDNNYEEIVSPQMFNDELWHISGHMKHFKEDMYLLGDEELAIKPMNCPGHILHFKRQKRCVDQLPIRIGELGRVHRKEDSGSINGLFRVRSFVQDDAHIFLRKEDISKEIKDLLSKALSLYKSLGFDKIKINFSSRPEKAVGSEELWAEAEASLLEVLADYDFNHKVGDGAFYGPKIDLHLEDSLGREHQVGSIQLDFNLAERFDAKFFNEEGKKEYPIIIHRAIFGSIERFLGLLLEHHQAWLPDLLVEKRIAILPVGDKHKEYCQGLSIDASFILEEGSISSRMKKCYKERIPYVIVIGDKEMESGEYVIKSLAPKDIE